MVQREKILKYLAVASLMAACATSQAAPLSDSGPDSGSMLIDASPADASLPAAAAPPKLVSRRVLIVGDSEACAVGYVVKDTVQKINDEAKQPRDTVNVDCKGGTVVQYWADQGHLKQALVKHPSPDVVIVFLGTNHYWQTRGDGDAGWPTTLSMVRNATAIGKEIRVSGASCVWVGNTAVKGRSWPVNVILREAVSPDLCTYFDTEAANIPLADGVHPTTAGAVKWLRAVWQVLPPKYEEADE